MTYLDLINRFWSIHDNVLFGAHEIALYFFLLRECNRQGWPSPFVCPNRSLCMGVGISESTLIRCRGRLKDLGVLDFKPGKDKRKAPLYYFQSESSSASSCASSRASSSASSRASSGDGINKNRRLKDTPTGGEKKDKPSSLVTRARKIFEEHFQSVYGEAYYYAAKDAGNLKQLLGKIAHSRKERKDPLPVDDDSLLDAFKLFLGSIDGGWISGNFSLPIINSKYNELISKIKNQCKPNGTTTNYQPDVAAAERQRRQSDIASYVARNIGSDRDAPGGKGTDMPF